MNEPDQVIAGRYRLIAKIGHGATGQVWRGYDETLNRDVAIKIVQLEGAKDPALPERFRREGVVIAGIDHPGVVRVYDTGTDGGRGWLVMDLLNGPNLNALVNRSGPLPYQTALPILAQVADGLQAAHQAKVTHRDIKPANIVLHAPTGEDDPPVDLYVHPDQGRPALIDFGIARLVGQAGRHLTKTSMAIGTAAYMSPEQARAKKVGAPSDIYSLGCVAYFVLTGHPPFVGGSSVAVAHAQAFDTPVPLRKVIRGIPPSLSALVDQMLAKDPADRPTAGQVRDAFLAISTDPESTPATGPGTLANPTTTAPDIPAVPRGIVKSRSGLVAGLIVLAALAGLGWSWAAINKPTPAPTVTATQTTTATATSEESDQTQPQPPNAPEATAEAGTVPPTTSEPVNPTPTTADKPPTVTTQPENPATESIPNPSEGTNTTIEPSEPTPR